MSRVILVHRTGRPLSEDEIEEIEAQVDHAASSLALRWLSERSEEALADPVDAGLDIGSCAREAARAAIQAAHGVEYVEIDDDSTLVGGAGGLH